MLEAKVRLRTWARELAPPTPHEQAGVVAVVRRWLSDSPRGSTVLTYLAMPGELDLGGLVELLPHLRWCVTRTPDSGSLTVHDFSAPRHRHRFGFEQPVEGAVELDSAEVDVVLTPGLLFDWRGRRLGWGLGYFDELLSRLRPDAVAVGITIERRVVAALPEEPHDRRMNLIATEHGVVSAL